MKKLNYILKLNRYYDEYSYYYRGKENRIFNIHLNCKNKNFFPNTNFFKIW